MSSVDTIYGPVTNNLMFKLARIKLLVCDVDGVFSDGSIYLGNQGEEYKAFNTLDGFGVKALQNIGVQVAIVTGRTSTIVENRMKSLGVNWIIQGEENKASAVKLLKQKLGFKKEQVASFGDDIPDIGMFKESAFGVSVPNGHPIVKNSAEYITTRQGGSGAVRELCDLILFANNKLAQATGSSV